MFPFLCWVEINSFRRWFITAIAARKWQFVLQNVLQWKLFELRAFLCEAGQSCKSYENSWNKGKQVWKVKLDRVNSCQTQLDIPYKMAGHSCYSRPGEIHLEFFPNKPWTTDGGCLLCPRQCSVQCSVYSGTGWQTTQPADRIPITASCSKEPDKKFPYISPNAPIIASLFQILRACQPWPVILAANKAGNGRETPSKTKSTLI